MKKALAIVIPARGGSKGIPFKNIRRFCGKPLLAYAILAARKAAITDAIFVSTDSDKIARVATRYGAVVIRRPREIAGDKASTESALLHAVDWIRANEGWSPVSIMTLQPTSPLRTAETIEAFYKAFKRLSGKHDAQLTLTVTCQDHWIKSNGSFRRLFPNSPRRRQGREPLYVENSAIYITKADSLLKTGSILGYRPAGYLINELEGLDINTPQDLILARSLKKVL